MEEKQPLSWPELRKRLTRYLPSTLMSHLRRLPDDLHQLDSEHLSQISNILLEATQTLSPLHRVLVHYMPRYLLELNPTPNQPHGEILSGSFIFADVSGFTALTEMLAKAGDAKGREILNQIMNRLFSTVLDPIVASGGDMLIFVGDAALVYFPHEESGDDLHKAIRAGLRMQRAIVPFKALETEFGMCSLTMSIGIERGDAYAGVVGTSQRMELLVSGPATFEAMRAEATAQSEQVMLGQAAVKIAQPHFTLDGALVVDDLGDDLGDYEINTPTRRRGSGMFFGRGVDELLATLQTNLERVERLAPFVPEDMLALLVSRERRRKLQAEFRPVAVQFINVLGVEELAIQHGPEVATEVFQQYFNKVNQIVKQHEGIISQIDAYSSGFFFLNTFGVPKAHEGTTLYAVSAALQLSKALERINTQFNLDPPLRQRGGITYGLTFNGEIGADYRRESVIAGPAVNRAARLMSKSEAGQIILDSDIWMRTRHAFVGDTLPAVQLKGIDGEVVIINVREVRQGTQLPPLERTLLEREADLAQLTEGVVALKRGQQSSHWFVSGETGLGKTSLMAALAQVASQTEATFLVGNCQPYSRYSPLFAWIDMLVGWFDLDPQYPATQQRSRLERKLVDLDLTDLADEMASLLSISGDEGESAANIVTAPQLILEFLERLSTRQAVVMVLENVHWIDGESQQLLSHLLADDVNWPLMLVLTGNEQVGYETTTEIALQPLSDGAAVEVAKRSLKTEQLEQPLASWVCQKAKGNPLYVEELCRALQQSEAIWFDEAQEQTRWTGDIPTIPLSLHELLLSRLDQQPFNQQELLKRGAVFGGTFSEAGIIALSKPQLVAEEVQEALTGTVAAAFLTANDATYSFTHPLMQEAIYATLSFQQRQTWHGQIADWFLSQQAYTDQFLPDIVYHSMRAADVKKAAKFGLLAGDKARDQESYAGALEYYQQVAALTDLPSETRQQALESQADVLALQGHYAAAAAVYQQLSDQRGDIAGKRAILLGDLPTLTEMSFDDTLRVWAAGSRAWLLAQNGDAEAALPIAQTALSEAHGPAHTALSVLAQNLEYQRPLDPYSAWVQRFVTAVLHKGVSTIDLLDMSTAHSTIINVLARQRKMSLTQIAEAVGQTVEQVQPVVDELVAKGQVKQVTIKNDVWYKAHFARKVKKQLSSDLWNALEL